MSAAAGAVVLAGASLPWLLREGPPSAAGTTGPGPLNLVVLSAVVGCVLLFVASLRTSWTGMVALLGGMLCGIVVFAGTIPAHAAGSHPGFGLFAVGAGGVLAVVGGVLNGIERDDGSL